MKYTLCFILLLLSFSTKEKEIDFDVVVMNPIQQASLFHIITWQECRGCKEKELAAVVGVIKNRLISSKFPNNIDSLLLQKGQFTKPVIQDIPLSFCNKVDSLFNKKTQHNFLYFANLSEITNPKILKKIKSYKLTKIGSQHFY